MELNEEKDSFSEALKNLVADLRIFVIAFKRLGVNIVNLVKSIKIDSIAALIRSVYFRWILSIVAVILFIAYFVQSCSGNNDENIDINEDNISCVESKNVVSGFTLRVEPPAVKHKLSNISYRKEFNDLNDTHLAAAKKIGIKPLKNRDDVANVSRVLVDITNENAYEVDSLTHSIPYLVPEAAALLKKIGENFQDSLAMKHMPPHKVIVTSVLRTQSDVKRLKRGNVNSTENSVHCFATTIDISHKRFLSVNGETTENQAKLKLVLGEVLRDLKKAGYCYVKHEKKQACFHITARKAPK